MFMWPLIVSYSDGEGELAGVGAAAWASWLEHPVAAYTRVPNEIRELWSTMANRDQYKDIYLIEAVGPLLLLVAFPRLMRNALWLHFVDNTSAEAALVKGSSSLEAADHIVGLTWELCALRSLVPYFDRVESKANPVDALSRGDAIGPWREVVAVDFPMDLLTDLANECGGWTPDTARANQDSGQAEPRR